MSLLANETKNAAFETESDADMIAATASAAKTAAATATTPAEAAPTANVPTVQATGAVALRAAKGAFEAFRDALRVDYNTLDQIIASNGNFVERENKTVLGDTVTFDLLSFQDSFVVSPEDDKAPKETVRYSDDGLVCSDGTDVKEHLDWLRASGYPKARLKQRVVVVGAITSAAKTEKFNGQLVQFDLSPASRTMWQRFVANVTYGLTTGRITQEQASKVKAEAQLKSRGSETYTVAAFNVAG